METSNKIFKGHYPEYGIDENGNRIVIGMIEYEDEYEYEDEITCPECGSNAIIEYEDTNSYDDDIEHETEYEFHCANCGKNF